MILQACVGLLLLLTLNGILVVATPGFKLFNIRFGKTKSFDYDYENVKSKMYNVQTTVTGKKQNCEKRITATGNGVGDVFTQPCTPNGAIIITSGKLLIYGNPNSQWKHDTLTLFSDSPSNLVVFKDGKCTNRKYQTVNGKTVAEIGDMNDEDCNQVHNKIRNLIEQGSKHLEDIDKNSKEKQTRSTSSVFSPLTGLSKSVVTGNQKSAGSNKQGSSSKPAESETVGDVHEKTSQNGISVTEHISSSIKSGVATVGRPVSSLTADTVALGGLLNSKVNKLKKQVSSGLL